MKAFISLLIVLSIFSCKKEKDVNYIVFSGVIKNQVNDYLILTKSNKDIDTINIDSVGTFIDTLFINNGYYLISHGKTFLRPYFEVGEDFSVNFDVENFTETLRYEGSGAEINNYVTKKRQNELDIIENRAEFYGLPESEYKSKVYAIKDNNIKLLKEYEAISINFKSKELKNIEYEFVNNLLSYEEFHAYFTKVDSFEVSSTFLPDLSNFDFNNGKDYLFSPAYKRILNLSLKDSTEAVLKTKDSPRDIVLLSRIAEIDNDTIRNSMLYNESVYGITYTNNLDDYYKIFMNGSTNQNDKLEITEAFQKLKKVDKGQVSPEFIDYINFNGGKNSLSDYQGKYVYIDIWATWCAPCKKEIPFLKEIEQQYKNKNIEFISISIDKQSDFDKWKKMVSQENLSGIQLYADNAWNSQFVQDYLIKGIPRFIIIDPVGKIYNANAPRPSDKDLHKQFESMNI
ncbi:thioredoxin domain protein [Formosa agariphila KMM 3901]|uniref:Thioredoxin domain protein n=1 Tax=Formosa agariphila (strain DSM 15362 / KCTC 12365 / LMG 23005 / KMM 3901 / M-2Alg 35-1) TaxID=1347342 RepID=T2KJN3_FORAG|nr:TlpA disulfide reductase family protein [Formosa agariphila]CDF78638.1 thioredoxin domain protein [Formosa agariphila KMM 3901]